MKKLIFPKGCDLCGEDRELILYPTDKGVIEVCRKCENNAWFLSR